MASLAPAREWLEEKGEQMLLHHEPSGQPDKLTSSMWKAKRLGKPRMWPQVFGRLPSVCCLALGVVRLVWALAWKPSGDRRLVHIQDIVVSLWVGWVQIEPFFSRDEGEFC